MWNGKINPAAISLLAFMGSYTCWRLVNQPIRHLKLYSQKPQQSVRQLRPFDNDKEANASNGTKRTNSYSVCACGCVEIIQVVLRKNGFMVLVWNQFCFC